MGDHERRVEALLAFRDTIGDGSIAESILTTDGAGKTVAIQMTAEAFGRAIVTTDSVPCRVVRAE